LPSPSCYGLPSCQPRGLRGNGRATPAFYSCHTARLADSAPSLLRRNIGLRSPPGKLPKTGIAEQKNQKGRGTFAAIVGLLASFRGCFQIGRASCREGVV